MGWTWLSTAAYRPFEIAPKSVDLARCGSPGNPAAGQGVETVRIQDAIIPSLLQSRDYFDRKGSGEISMSTHENVQIVKDFFAAMGRGDKQGLLALSAENIEWIIPGEDWPLAGTHRGHADWQVCFRRLPKCGNFIPKAPEFVAQGDRVLVVGSLQANQSHE